MYRTIINYRREDSGGWAGRLHDRLIAHFGESEVFIDVDDIDIGEDYRKIILNNVACSDIMISVIGPRWADCKDKNGKYRLHLEDDLLREEIKVAIEKQVDLFPVLVDNASMPLSDVLPKDIQPLVSKHGYDIDNKHFHRDVTELIEKLTLALKLADERKRPLSLKEKIEDLEKQLYEANLALKIEEREYYQAPESDQTPLESVEEMHSSKPFNAFMIYSHSSDSTLAASLQDALQNIGKHWFKSHSLRIFRDATNLTASPTLWSNIKNMIDNSEYLILLASTHASKSRWVNEEVKYWIQNRSVSKILIALTDGAISWDNLSNDFDWNKTDALPAVLKGVFSEEPFFIDLREVRNDHHLSLNNPKFLIPVSKLAAVFQGKPPRDLISENERQKQLKSSLLIIGIIIIIAITILFLTKSFS